MKKLSISLAIIILIGCTVAAGLPVQKPTFNAGATDSALRAVLNHLHFGLADFDATNYGFARARMVRAQEETQALYDDLFESLPPVPPPPVDHGIPDLSDVTVLRPGTESVLSWPVVVDLDMIARLDGEDIRIEWPAMLGSWPESIHDLSSAGPRPYIGVTGWIYKTNNRWVAHPNEYARPDMEQLGTWWLWAEKFAQAQEDNPGIDLGMPDAGTPIGIFIAGMWRHTNDLPEYRHRSEIVWFTWPELIRLWVN